MLIARRSPARRWAARSNPPRIIRTWRGARRQRAQASVWFDSRRQAAGRRCRAGQCGDERRRGLRRQRSAQYRALRHAADRDRAGRRRAPRRQRRGGAGGDRRRLRGGRTHHRRDDAGFRERGFHGSHGAIFAATVAAARLLQLDAEQTTHAIALTATSTGGLAKAADTSVAREYHAGHGDDARHPGGAGGAARLQGARSAFWR